MIEFENVTKIYPGSKKPALENVNLSIEESEFVFLVGPSGSGKTTFIKLLLREILPTKGTVRVAGIDVTKLRSWKVPYLRRHIGCVFQDFKLLPNKTAYENVAFALEVLGRPKRLIEEQVMEVLRLVGLEHKASNFPNELSGGEQQRISIARAIVNHPPILLADEPTGNLDPATSAELMGLFDRINRTGTTVVIATHNKELVDIMRKRVIALEDGKIVRDQVRGVYGYEI
ncbi:MAG: cell division ATP-binding protein FtsE [Actinobacteria bacterium]|nr:cell division ATP-binding protein FtsE [Actinomycetota bacterium]